MLYDPRVVVVVAVALVTWKKKRVDLVRLKPTFFAVVVFLVFVVFLLLLFLFVCLFFVSLSLSLWLLVVL